MLRPFISFNDSLPSGSVVLAVDRRYNDNDGETTWAVIWTGEEVYSECIESGYSYRGTAKVDATQEQRADAVEWYRNSVKTPTHLTGCEVILKRSRKAPNGVALRVLDHQQSYFNPVYYCREPERIKVLVDDTPVWVSASCVDSIVRIPAPWWA